MQEKDEVGGGGGEGGMLKDEIMNRDECCAG